MSMKRFFAAVESEAVLLAGGMRVRGSKPIEVLDRALARAMVSETRGKQPVFRLRVGEGVQARARILVASSRLGLADTTMQPGESVGEWLGRGLRERLDHTQVIPLIRAAAREGSVKLRDLEARAS